MTMLNESITTPKVDGLLVDNNPPADVASVKLAAGEYKRGTVVTGAAGENLVAASEALVASNATYILCDDVNAEAGQVTFAYRTGHFNANALITGGSYALVAADKEVLRGKGILLSDAVEY